MPITYSRLSDCATADFRQSFRGFRELPANAYAGAQERGSRPISRVLSWTIIPLGHSSPNASSSLPGSHARTPRCRFPCDFPIWPCSRWGLPCRPCCHVRGALLPHHFTLTCATLSGGTSAVSFCCTFRGLAPPRRYLAPCPKEPGLSSAFREKYSDRLADSGGHDTPR